MKVAEKVATAFGRIADEAALVEGARAGRLAGLEDPNYRPIGRSSLRGQSFETAANQSYAYSLSTRLREDMDAVYEANKSSPTQLSVALDQLKRQFAGDLFPEVRGPFDVEFSRLRYSYENTARRQHETKVKAEASDAFNANLLTRLASIDRISACHPGRSARYGRRKF
jgi:hypothetical protein